MSEWEGVTFQNDRSWVFEDTEDLIEGPAVVPSDLIVTDEDLVLRQMIEWTLVWLLQEIGGKKQFMVKKLKYHK